MRLKKNIGTADRLIRLAISAVLFGMGFWQRNWVVLGLAAFTLLEAALSWCIFYQLIGKNSCPINKR